MTITLVRQGNKLVGLTFSDRWNLSTLSLSLTYSRNQTDIKRARRANPDFTFRVVPGVMVATWSPAESDALSPVPALSLSLPCPLTA